VRGKSAALAWRGGAGAREGCLAEWRTFMPTAATLRPGVDNMVEATNRERKREANAAAGSGGSFAAALITMVTLVVALPPGAAAGTLGSWSDPHLLPAAGGSDAVDLGVAFTSQGWTAVVWLQSASEHHVWAAVFDPSAGWSSPVPISVGSLNANSPEVAASDDGSAMAVWTEADGSYLNVWASKFTPGWGWQAATQIVRDNDSDASVPKVAGGPNGRYVAVWDASDGSYERIWANIYDPRVGWGGDLILDGLFDNGEFPVAGFDAQGHILVMWDQYDGVRQSIGWARFTDNAGWSQAAWAESDNATDSFYVSVAVEQSGSAFAAWKAYNATGGFVVASEFTPGSGWGPVAVVSRDTGYDVGDEQVAADDTGAAFLTWTQYGGPVDQVMASHHTPASGWSAPVALSGPFADALDGKIASDGMGGAVAVFDQQGGGARDAFVDRYVAGKGWSGASRVDPYEAGLGLWPAVAVARDGQIAVGWSQYNGTILRAWASIYTPADTAAPSLALGAPSEGSVWSDPSVQVAGETEPGAIVSVNGQRAAVASDGSFSLAVPLSGGSTTLRVTAMDGAGNVAAATVNVTYDDPLPALRQDLAKVQADLAAAQAAQTATQAQLTASQASLTATQGQLAATQSSLNATQAQSGRAPASDPLPLIVALLGVALGAGALGVALMRRGDRGGHVGLTHVSGVRLEPPSAAAEPPKDPGDTRLQR
jgi:hypothetical protein